MLMSGCRCEEFFVDILVLERNTGLGISIFEFVGMNMVES